MHLGTKKFGQIREVVRIERSMPIILCGRLMELNSVRGRLRQCGQSTVAHKQI